MPQLNQERSPLVTTLKELADQPDTAFYAPGHKRGQGISKELAWLGKKVFQADLPELPELDNLFAPESVIQEAQELAADLWGAEQTWFLVNGSTCGIIAAILATCGDGDKLILPRNCHQSAIAGVIQSGAIPIFIEPAQNPEWDLAYSINAEDLENTLKKHPETKAVFALYPTYHGVCGDLKSLIDIAHHYNLPIIVDEAHAAHFHFHIQLPPSALSLGADIVIQSTHKLLGAFSQASMLHKQGHRVDSDRLSRALQIEQSTSPNYLLLASLDAARHQMANEGQQLLDRTLKLAGLARKKLSQIPGLKILTKPKKITQFFYDLDLTRLTIDISNWTLNSPPFSSQSQQSTSPFSSQQQSTSPFSSQSQQSTPPFSSQQQSTPPFLRGAGGDQTFQSETNEPQTFLRGAGENQLTGYEIDEILRQEFQITAELPTLRQITFIITIGNTLEDIEKLIAAFTILTDHYNCINHTPPQLPQLPPPETVLTPRQAFFSPTETVSQTAAVNQIAAELICPYPPGIPILIPGERITETAIAYLQQVKALGAMISGCSDDSLETFKVISAKQT